MKKPKNNRCIFQILTNLAENTNIFNLKIIIILNDFTYTNIIYTLFFYNLFKKYNIACIHFNFTLLPTFSLHILFLYLFTQ